MNRTSVLILWTWSGPQVHFYKEFPRRFVAYSATQSSLTRLWKYLSNNGFMGKYGKGTFQPNAVDVEFDVS